MDKKMTIISYADFEQVQLRSGTIIKVEDFPKAKRPAYKVWVDFGSEFGTLQTSAQVTANYTLENLLGRQVVGCINLGEKNIAGFMSQFLLVGFNDDKGNVCLVTVDPKVPNGLKLY
jgi:tRNA-binding protein